MLSRPSRLLPALLPALFAGGARAENKDVAIIVARGAGVEPSLTRGLAFKLGLEAQRRGLSSIAGPGNLASVLPAEDDPFFSDCFADDDCMLRLTATVGQPAVLLVIIEPRQDQRRARLAFVHAGSNILLRRARTLPAPFERSVEQDAMAALEAGLARVPGLRPAREELTSPETARRKTARLWNAKCATCHGKDGKAHTVMGEKLNLPDMSNQAWQTKFDDAKLKQLIIEGKQSRDNPTPEMGSFAARLTPEQVDALVGYVRSLKN